MPTPIDLTNGSDLLAHTKGNSSAFLQQLREMGLPIGLTINGKAVLVIQDAGSLQRLLELAERVATIEAIKESLDEFERGDRYPARQALAELREKHQTPSAT